MQGFADGGHQVAAGGNQRGQRGGQRVACAREHRLEPFELFTAQRRLRGSKHIVGILARQGDAGDQRVGDAHFGGGLGDVTGRRAFLAGPVRQQPAPQRAVVSYQHRGLRQKQFAKGVLVQIDLAFVPPRQVGHAGNDRYVGIVRCELGNRADIFRTPGESDLDHLRRRVLQNGPRLLGHGFLVQRKEVKYLGGVTGVSARHDRQGVGANRADRQDVAGQSASATGVACIEDQNTRRRGVVGPRGGLVGQDGNVRVCHRPKFRRKAGSVTGVGHDASIQSLHSM